MFTHVDELLARFQLMDRADEATRTLSGGLRRRLELARALLPEPEVLLLDEPTIGLDPESRRELWQLLRAFRDAGLTILLATNDVQEAERECDQVNFMHKGKLVAGGKPDELKRGLRHDSVRLDCVNGRAAELAGTVNSWPEVGRAVAAGPVLHVTVDDANAFVPRLFAAGAGGIRNIHIEPATLEDAYFEITGASLQADGEAQA
jgi:ABC-type multidrug transport system ATPase subunit